MKFEIVKMLFRMGLVSEGTFIRVLYRHMRYDNK